MYFGKFENPTFHFEYIYQIKWKIERVLWVLIISRISLISIINLSNIFPASNMHIFIKNKNKINIDSYNISKINYNNKHEMTCLFVGNLVKSATYQKLYDVFSAYGKCLVELKVILNLIKPHIGTICICRIR